MTTTRRERSSWCRAWLTSLGADEIVVPADRSEALAAALAQRGLPCSPAIEEADRTLYGLTINRMRFGIVEALAAAEGLDLDERACHPEEGPLIPLSDPRPDISMWCDVDGALVLVIYELDLRSSTFDSADHYLECEALQRVHLAARGDRFGFETSSHLGVQVASALGLEPLPGPSGTRCHVWTSDRAIVVDAAIEQYFFGTYVGLRDGAVVLDLLRQLPASEVRALRIIRGAAPPPEVAEGTRESVHAIANGAIWTYRDGDAVTAVYRERPR